jgi:putative transposase
MLREHSRHHDVRILGWCLMTNHVHLIVIPGTSGSLALALGQAHSEYSSEHNRHYGRIGHVRHANRCREESRHGTQECVRHKNIRSDAKQGGAEAEEARLGAWNYADWKAALLAADTAEELDRMRRAIKLGEPLRSDEFVRDLEAKAGRRLRVGARGRPIKKRVMAAGTVQQPLFGD